MIYNKITKIFYIYEKDKSVFTLYMNIYTNNALHKKKLRYIKFCIVKLF